MAKADLTAQRLRETLSYDQSTGLFCWLASRSNVRAGSVAGATKSDGYTQIGIDGRLYLAHRLAFLYVLGSMPSGDVDHINGVISDNRFSNLRDVPRLINMQNQRRAQKSNISGFLGVGFDRRRMKAPFYARIRLPGNTRPTFLGYFDSPSKASEAYIAAKRQFHDGCSI